MADTYADWSVMPRLARFRHINARRRRDRDVVYFVSRATVAAERRVDTALRRVDRRAERRRRRA